MKDWKEQFRNYKRFPIQIARTTYAIMHMYEYEYDHLEDIMVDDELHYKMCNVDFEQAADQFIKQFEGNDCRAFIDALYNRCAQYIEEDNKRREENKRKFEELELKNQ